MDCEYSLADKVNKFWTNALGNQDINPDASFFDCGGSSLGCIQMLANIVCTLNIQVDFDLFFANPTLKNLQELVTKDT